MWTMILLRYQDILGSVVEMANLPALSKPMQETTSKVMVLVGQWHGNCC